jgi:LytR cell envelope-related transcriptional attenuator
VIDLIEQIGPILGIAAFLGLAVLAFLIFQQGREVRRLREWAGRAPERAQEAADASLAAAEARGEAQQEEPHRGPIGSRLAAGRSRLATRFGPAWDALDRRSPIDPRYFVVVVVAAIVAAGVLTSGFGLLGADEGNGREKRAGAEKRQKKEESQSKPEVAVLNATQEVGDSGVELGGVPGLAKKVADQVLKPEGYPAGRQADAASGFDETVVMFEPEHEAEADELAGVVEAQLGPTEALPMIEDVRELADGADLALLVGRDDARF